MPTKAVSKEASIKKLPTLLPSWNLVNPVGPMSQKPVSLCVEPALSSPKKAYLTAESHLHSSPAGLHHQDTSPYSPKRQGPPLPSGEADPGTGPESHSPSQFSRRHPNKAGYINLMEWRSSLPRLDKISPTAMSEELPKLSYDDAVSSRSSVLPAGLVAFGHQTDFLLHGGTIIGSPGAKPYSPGRLYAASRSSHVVRGRTHSNAGVAESSSSIAHPPLHALNHSASFQRVHLEPLPIQSGMELAQVPGADNLLRCAQPEASYSKSDDEGEGTPLCLVKDRRSPFLSAPRSPSTVPSNPTTVTAQPLRSITSTPIPGAALSGTPGVTSPKPESSFQSTNSLHRRSSSGHIAKEDEPVHSSTRQNHGLLARYGCSSPLTDTTTILESIGQEEAAGKQVAVEAGVQVPRRPARMPHMTCPPDLSKQPDLSWGAQSRSIPTALNAIVEPGSPGAVAFPTGRRVGTAVGGISSRGSAPITHERPELNRDIIAAEVAADISLPRWALAARRTTHVSRAQPSQPDGYLRVVEASTGSPSVPEKQLLRPLGPAPGTHSSPLPERQVLGKPRVVQAPSRRNSMIGVEPGSPYRRQLGPSSGHSPKMDTKAPAGLPDVLAPELAQGAPNPRLPHRIHQAKLSSSPPASIPQAPYYKMPHSKEEVRSVGWSHSLRVRDEGPSHQAGNGAEDGAASSDSDSEAGLQREYDPKSRHVNKVGDAESGAQKPAKLVTVKEELSSGSPRSPRATKDDEGEGEEVDFEGMLRMHALLKRDSRTDVGASARAAREAVTSKFLSMKSRVSPVARLMFELEMAQKLP